MAKKLVIFSDEIHFHHSKSKTQHPLLFSPLEQRQRQVSQESPPETRPIATSVESRVRSYLGKSWTILDQYINRKSNQAVRKYCHSLESTDAYAIYEVVVFLGVYCISMMLIGSENWTRTILIVGSVGMVNTKLHPYVKGFIGMFSTYLTHCSMRIVCWNAVQLAIFSYQAWQMYNTRRFIRLMDKIQELEKKYMELSENLLVNIKKAEVVARGYGLNVILPPISRLELNSSGMRKQSLLLRETLAETQQKLAYVLSAIVNRKICLRDIQRDERYQTDGSTPSLLIASLSRHQEILRREFGQFHEQIKHRLSENGYKSSISRSYILRRCVGPLADAHEEIAKACTRLAAAKKLQFEDDTNRPNPTNHHMFNNIHRKHLQTLLLSIQSTRSDLDAASVDMFNCEHDIRRLFLAKDEDVDKRLEELKTQLNSLSRRLPSYLQSIEESINEAIRLSDFKGQATPVRTEEASVGSDEQLTDVEEEMRHECALDAVASEEDDSCTQIYSGISADQEEKDVQSALSRLNSAAVSSTSLVPVLSELQNVLGTRKLPTEKEKSMNKEKLKSQSQTRAKKSTNACSREPDLLPRVLEPVDLQSELRNALGLREANVDEFAIGD